jgi:hypothetical protein
VCLQEKIEIKTHKLPVYYSTVELKKTQKKTGVKSIKYDNKLEIPDISIGKDGPVYDYVNELYEKYLDGENFVIHCLGGHGRTGTIAALLLAFILLGEGIVLKATELLNVIQLCHSQREQRNGWTLCPQTISQCNQVQRLYYQRIESLELSIEREPYKVPPPVKKEIIYKSQLPDKATLPVEIGRPAWWDIEAELVNECDWFELSDQNDEDYDKESLTLGDFFCCLPCTPKKEKKAPIKKTPTKTQDAPSVTRPQVKQTYKKRPNKLVFEMSDLI